MSWLFSRALVEGYSRANSSDGERSAALRLIPTAQLFSPPGKMTGFSKLVRYGMTCAPLTADRGEDLLTWYREDFLARTSAALEREMELKASEADSGESLPASLAKFDPDTHSLKTRQTLLFEDSTESLVILPDWGWMQDGECFQLAPLVLHTCDKECSVWPTPRADGRDNCGGSNARRRAQATGTYIGRYPNPLFQERLMGWPIQWSALDALEMDKFQQWLRSHGGCWHE